MRANRLAGHFLPHEGRINAGRTAEGRGQCSCGATSAVLPSAAARRRWHRDEHKVRVREHGHDASAAYSAAAEQVLDLYAALEAEIAWQRGKYGDGSDKVATGRLIGMEDALRTVRQHLTPKAP